jgi:hypothetical protein
MEVRSIETVVRALNQAKVQYLIVGGLAVNAHGYERLTRDVDLVIGLERENIDRTFRALLDLGYQMAVPVTPEEFADPAMREMWRREKNMIVLQFCSDAHRRTPVDVFVFEPFDFALEYGRATRERIAGDTEAFIVSYETLLAMKQSAGRDRDLLDVRELRKLDPYR